ncbi:MAG TPA: IS110 family transposase [Acidimicrobiia bacterium]|jgi:transposase
MTIIAPTVRHVTGGVDTHGEIHVAAVLDSTTAVELADRSFAADAAGYHELEVWLKGFGVVDAVGVEATGSWGAGLTRHLSGRDVQVVEVDRPDRKARRFEGKTDATDARAAARAVIARRARAVPKSRDGNVEALRAIEVVCHGAVKDRTRAINQFHALVVSAPESLRQQFRRLTLTKQLAKARRFADRDSDDVVCNETRIALKELARRIGFLDEHIHRLETRLNTLTAQAAPALLGMFAVGPHVAAQLLAAAGDNPHRMTSEASFAKLCGACPIPASSGKTQRHRLNRGGDRRANNALHTIVLVRLRYHPPTRTYAARRRTEGKTTAEIARCLKRFVAREAYQAITNPPDDLITGTELRALRNQHGLSLTHVCNAIRTTPITLSRIERGLAHDTNLAQAAHTWILENNP